MQRTRIKWFALTLILILASVYPFQVNAQEQTNLEKSQNELHQMQADQQKLTSSLDTTLQNARSLELQVSNLMYQSMSLQNQIDTTKKQINTSNAQFMERLRVEYQDGDVSFLEVLLDSKDFSDFLDRFDMLTLIAKQDQTLINELHTKNSQLEQEQKHLSQQLQEKESKHQQLLTLESSLRQQIQESNSQIAAKEQDIYQEQQAFQAPQEQQQQEASQTSNLQSTALASRGESLLSASTGTYLEMTATAYTAPSNARTASGAKVAAGTAAVDPSVIPLGTKLYIEGYGYAVASDTGPDIKGNRIDLFFNSVDQCLLFGRRTVKVYTVK